MDIKLNSRTAGFNFAIWGLVLLPLLMSFYGFYQVQFVGNIFYYGPEPGKAIVHFLGEWAIAFLLLVIAIRPIHKLTAIQLRPYSRRVGLAAFFYGLVHVFAYFAFIQGFVWQELWGGLA
ncbi:hypothetical protein [Bermanella marisrubri]|uniref:Ferric oxidoreductase domain-containing protein n=1 Tax=Bermanella marisrubri TaxID=207949 RepID=Q1N3G4_9GAMM|nr:hypothetical protein [Bermanella marisrubri]EAT12910.1 hypothetical protein RED65_12594 [Oceanobacter sp. RED65] [Bermanella marisrubri]